jgi:hypothetical protein
MRHATLGCCRHQSVEQDAPDSALLVVVNHRNCGFGALGVLGQTDEARDAQRLFVAACEQANRTQSYVILAVDFREVRQIAVGETRLRAKKSPVS